jgi:hypothetical protein
MRRLVFIAVLCAFAASPAMAAMFTLNHDAAMMLIETGSSPEGSVFGTKLSLVTDDRTPPSPYGAVMPYYAVGYVGILEDLIGDTTYDPDPFAWIRIGAGAANVAHVIGTALGVADTDDLSGYASYYLPLSNDNDDIWQVKLYLSTTGGGMLQSTSWTPLAGGTHTTLTLDLTGLTDLANVTDLGFMIGANLTSLNGNPSNPDIFHMSAVPLPAGLLLAVLGLGAAGLKLRKFA